MPERKNVIGEAGVKVKEQGGAIA